LLLILTIVMVGGFFAAYLAMQKPAPRRGGASGLPATTPTPRETGSGDPLVGAGEELWARTYDRATGRLTLEFYAEQYDPQSDGTVIVKQPEARFHLRDGRYVAVSAEDGRVIISGGAGSARQLSQGQGGAPTRGELRDVTVELFDSARADEPILTCSLPVVSFDNDTFRIATEASVVDGKQVPADQAPVRVQGEDVQFDGRGLVIRWNGMTGQLDSLEVAHGERLTIRPGSNLFPKPLSLAPRPTDAFASAETVAPPTTRRKRKIKPVADASAPPAPPALYRATFHDTVRVEEGVTPVASATLLSIDFLVGEEGAVTPATPSNRPPKRPATSQRPPTRSRGSEAAPVTIRWTGPMRIQPIPADAPERPQDADDYIVQLHGIPAELSRDGSVARCASLRYRTGEDTVALLSSSEHPLVELRDAQGTLIRGQSVLVNRRTGVAVIDRAGEAELPLEEAGRKETARVAWTDRCDLVFRERDGRAAIDSVSLLGKVGLQHPRLTLSAGELSLSFEPPKTPARDGAPSSAASSLRLVRAVGDVRASFTNEDGTTGKLQAREMSVGMEPAGPSSASYVRTLSAEGGVLLSDARQSLRCDQMSALFDPPGHAGLAPSSGPALGIGGDARLNSFRAIGSVELADTESRGSACGTELQVAVAGNATQVALLGSPARVVDRNTTLEGPRIEFEPDADRGHVIGAGRLVARDPSNDNNLEVRWHDRIDYDGTANLAEVRGDVAAESVASDGARRTATAGRVTLVLAPATTQPSTQPNQGSENALAVTQPLGGRDVRQVIFREKVELGSVLNDAAGRLLQRTSLQSSEVRYDLTTRRLEVPMSGRMLYEDQRPADPGPSNDLVGDLRGATAFQWRDRLVFDEQALSARLDGDVKIVQQRADQPPLKLNAATVDADFVRDADATKRPSSLSLKRVLAHGGVSVTAPQARFDAPKVEYDPVAGQLIAGGDPSNPVETFDEQGLSRGGFERLIYNTRTRQIDKLEKPVGRIRR
jgi:hypothetical protein